MAERRCDRSCKFWAYDMDMDSFCTHPKAMEAEPSFGCSTNRMSREGLCPTPDNPLWEAMV